MKDIEIARKVILKDINDIASELGINSDNIIQYGKYKAKISSNQKIDPKGKLILVTAISPTPLGEGKTTVSISLADALSKLGKKSILSLREPSLGPVFGRKGGATGGGFSQVAPMEEINLHFTGDMHAITSANNLISSLIDNHIYYGNELNFDKILWKRCLDLNDRQLRLIRTGLSEEKINIQRDDSFEITAASEIMAILCLSENLVDLENKLSNILLGYNKDKPIFLKDINAQGSVAVLLKDALQPNLVQTLEHTPALIHGGPFANIAHGCSSIVATKLGMSLADYTITEAGFGADLGAEKFFNIKCKKMGIEPDAVVLVVTLKAIKFHSGSDINNILEENIDFIEKGLWNTFKHIKNLKEEFGANVVVAINKFETDSKNELDFVLEKFKENNIVASVVDGWSKGSDGAIDIASKIIERSNINKNIINTYNDTDFLKEKIEKVATKIYGATNVNYSKEAEESILRISSMGCNLPVCIAKTQYSLTDNPNLINPTDKYDLNVRDIEIKSGAGFIVVLVGDIMTMPGLPKIPAANNIGISKSGDVYGIF
ncbi:MAG: formate--tetrahydrofolate ligase [bacterium]